MNRLVYKICEYIIRERIKQINIDNIVRNNINEIVTYLPEKDIYSFLFNTYIFKKLVLYNYCFHYKIIGLSNNEEILIANYIHNKINELNILNLGVDVMQFLDWCRKYNQQNKKNIYIVSSHNNKIKYLNNTQMFSFPYK
jgi:hypothetical protein